MLWIDEDGIEGGLVSLYSFLMADKMGILLCLGCCYHETMNLWCRRKLPACQRSILEGLSWVLAQYERQQISLCSTIARFGYTSIFGREIDA